MHGSSSEYTKGRLYTLRLRDIIGDITGTSESYHWATDGAVCEDGAHGCGGCFLLPRASQGGPGRGHTGEGKAGQLPHANVGARENLRGARRQDREGAEGNSGRKEVMGGERGRKAGGVEKRAGGGMRMQAGRR